MTARKPAEKTDTAASKAAADDREECSICLSSLADVAAMNLECAHKFHFDCVTKLRKFGVEQSFPLCRAPLPAGPEKFFEEATRRFIVFERKVARVEASWFNLPQSAQRELDGAISNLQAAAELGSV